MRKYLRVIIVLAVFFAAVLVHDLQGGSRKFASAAPGDNVSIPAPVLPTTASPPPTTTASLPTFTPVPPTTAKPSSPATAATPTPTPSPSPSPTPQNAGQYRDGSYTGSPADAYYGALQVQAVVANGRLVDVKFLQYPNHTRTSQRINQQVMPWLTQEAVQVQSARINVISGASASSYAFAQSLNSALAKAK